MKKTLRILAVVLVVALFGALLLVGTGCSKKDTTSDDTTTGTETETDTGEATENEGTPTGDPAAGEVALAGACTQCHELTRVYLQPEYADWNGLILRMEDAHGAVLTDQEKADIAAFLGNRQQTEAEQLVQNKCTECHDLQRLYEQPIGTNWENVMGTMISKHGAVLTEEEQAEIAAYLDNL